jgi:hypothetical protein
VIFDWNPAIFGIPRLSCFLLNVQRVNGAGISKSVQSFIAERIRSVIELEALLLLQADPSRGWTPEDLGRELRINPAFAAAELADLASGGLIAALPDAPSRYHYAPRTPDLDAGARELAVAYVSRRVTVIQLIFAKPPDPVRNFADAFKFRKDDSRG